MNYLTVTQAAEKWGISTRRVRLLCANGDIAGVTRKGNLYLIPEDTQQEMDCVTAEENFIMGFRLGVRIMVECLGREEGD